MTKTNCFEILSLLRNTDVDAYEAVMNWVKPVVTMKLSVLKEGQIVHSEHFKMCSEMIEKRGHVYHGSYVKPHSRYYLKYLRGDIFNTNFTNLRRMNNGNVAMTCCDGNPLEELKSWRLSKRGSGYRTVQEESWDINLFGVNIHSQEVPNWGREPREFKLICPSTKDEIFKAATENGVLVKKSWTKNKMLTCMIKSTHRDRCVKIK